MGNNNFLCHPREGGGPGEWIPAFAGMTQGNPIIFLNTNKVIVT